MGGARASPSSPIASASPHVKSHYALQRHNNYALPVDVNRIAGATTNNTTGALVPGTHSPSKSPSDVGRVLPFDSGLPPLSLPPAGLTSSSAAMTATAAPAPAAASTLRHTESEEKEAQLFSPAYALPATETSSCDASSGQHVHPHSLSVNALQTTVAAQSAVVATAVAAGHVTNTVTTVQQQQQQQQRGATGAAASAAQPSQPPSAAAAAAAAAAEEAFDPFLFIKNLPPLSQAVRTCSVPVLPARSPSAPRVALALDLDETLVHCSVEPLPKYDLTFTVHFAGSDFCVYVKLRPHLYHFLRTVRAWFEVIIFTASQRIYAEKLLNILEREERFTHHRLFRDSCVCVEGNYLKDLTVLGRPLSSTCILDNSVQAFGFQLDNGIPILGWFDDESDDELLKLLPFLDHLRSCQDVRPTLKHTFKLSEFVHSL
jgi:CTD small phosphatase-like protein 2